MDDLTARAGAEARHGARRLRPVARAVGIIVLLLGCFIALLAVVVWLGPRQRRASPEIDRKVEETRRQIRALHAHDRARPQELLTPVDHTDIDEGLPGWEAGEYVDPLQGLSPEARKYLPADSSPSNVP